MTANKIKNKSLKLFTLLMKTLKMVKNFENSD